jgi:hypothetical protein
MQDFFRCQEGMRAHVDLVVTKSYKKLVVDQHYEVHIQAIVTYYDSVLGQRLKKDATRTMQLTRDQYLQVDK